MSNNSIIDDLKGQMASAAFKQKVEEHIHSIEIAVMLSAKFNGVASDILIVILGVIIGRLLINECPDHARQHYVDLAKRIIDGAAALSNKE